MARSRGRRRRQNLKLLVTLAVTLALVVLVRDVARLAQQSNSQRVSLNRTFGALATGMLNDEEVLRGEVTSILTGSAPLTRVELAARMLVVQRSAELMRQRVAELAKPTIAHQLQRTLITVTNQRVSAVEALVATLSAALELPGTPTDGVSVASIEQSIQASDTLWAAARTELESEPGHVSLPASIFVLTSEPLATAVAALLAEPLLAPTRAMMISAVSISPAPLPALIGQLNLIPVNIISLGVSVRNTKYIAQPFTVTVTIVPIGTRGFAIARSVTASTSPLGSRALVFASLRVIPGERATLKISLTGVQAASFASAVRQYTLSIAGAPTR